MFQTILSAILFAGTGIVLIAPQMPVIRKISEYSVHIMLGMLLFSMIALVFNKTKLMFASLACTAALCIFLKNASHSTLKLPQENTEARLNVAHINLSNITFDFEPIKDVLKNEDIDLISFQEFTPDWKMFLHGALKEVYPYAFTEVRIDPYGLAIFSKTPFMVSDTFVSNNIPNMNIVVTKERKKFQVISSYLTPALDNQSLKLASKQLGAIATKIKSSDYPLIAMGEYNMVYWTNEIRGFRAQTNLQNSRRDLIESNLRVPYDHIFFSDALECTQFKEIKDKAQNYIGIMGTYQIKNEDDSFHTLNSQLSLID